MYAQVFWLNLCVDYTWIANNLQTDSSLHSIWLYIPEKIGAMVFGCCWCCCCRPEWMHTRICGFFTTFRPVPCTMCALIMYCDWCNPFFLTTTAEAADKYQYALLIDFTTVRNRHNYQRKSNGMYHRNPFFWYSHSPIFSLSLSLCIHPSLIMAERSVQFQHYSAD